MSVNNGVIGVVLQNDHYIVVIGDSNLDIAATSLFPVSAQATLPCDGIRYKNGGCSRNVAENLVRLGCDTRLISAFGDDLDGLELMAGATRLGIDLSGSRQMPGCPTPVSLIVNNHDGEHFLTIGDISLVASLTPDWLARHHALLNDAALIVTNTTLSQESLAWLFSSVHDVPVFVDTVGAHYVDHVSAYLSRVHTLKLNRAEACRLSGMTFSSREDALMIAHWFHQVGVEQLVLSMGGFGLFYSNGQQADWLSPLKVNVVNVTGAGDALMAGLAYGWLHRFSFVDTMYFSRAAAALTLTTHDNNYRGLSCQTVNACSGLYSVSR
jgi:pseudouridine kinase